MPARFSNDEDLVLPDPKKARSKKPAPPPWEMPKFEPHRPPLHTGRPNVPPHVNRSKPGEVFDLFLAPEIIDKLVEFTNLNAERNPRAEDDLTGHQQRWRPCTREEIYAYIGVTISFGLTPLPMREMYWNSTEEGGPLLPVLRRAISRDRFRLIDRFFYLSEPLYRKAYPPKPTSPPPPSPPPPKTQIKKRKRGERPEIQVHEDGVAYEYRNLFEKIEWLSDHIREMSKKYWLAGTHLAVDESIARFTGRAKEKVTIPSKPTPEGFKVWILANQGYVLDWIYHAKGEGNGPWDIDLDRWVKGLGFSKTQAVVLDLIEELITKAPQGGKDFIIWMDNLFTSVKLLSQLKKMGIGAAGTVRTTKTKRELLEEGFSTSQAEAVFEVGGSTEGLPQEITEPAYKAQSKTSKSKPSPALKSEPIQRSLTDLKELGTTIPRGQLYGAISKDGDVLELAWKDAAVVLFMTTVHDGTETIIRPRRRPVSITAASRETAKVFGSEIIKNLSIPLAIDQYNHYMNGVDNADQLRASYITQRRHMQTWKPLWHFLLDTTTVNAYKLSTDSEPGHYKTSAHRKWLQKLVNEIFLRAGVPPESNPQPHTHTNIRDYVAAIDPDEHHLVRLPGKKGYCKACQDRRNLASKCPLRKPVLTETSHNSRRKMPGTDGIGRRRREPTAVTGCDVCGIHICKEAKNPACWQQHLDAISL
jgi:hypothetical protein